MRASSASTYTAGRTRADPGTNASQTPSTMPAVSGSSTFRSVIPPMIGPATTVTRPDSRSRYRNVVLTSGWFRHCPGATVRDREGWCRVSEPVQELQSVDDDERATRDADPAYLSPDYVGTRLRSPRRPLLLLPRTLSDLSGPAFRPDDVQEGDSDLTTQHAGEPLGERIIVSGRVLGSDGRPVRNALVEIWQANSAGRYHHRVDQHPAPLDPNFTGGGRTVADDDGRYRFITIKPGSYPWKNHHNAWR